MLIVPRPATSTSRCTLDQIFLEIWVLLQIWSKFSEVITRSTYVPRPATSTSWCTSSRLFSEILVLFANCPKLSDIIFRAQTRFRSRTRIVLGPGSCSDPFCARTRIVLGPGSCSDPDRARTRFCVISEFFRIIYFQLPQGLFGKAQQRPELQTNVSCIGARAAPEHGGGMVCVDGTRTSRHANVLLSSHILHPHNTMLRTICGCRRPVQIHACSRWTAGSMPDFSSVRRRRAW
jgi:hypothetical protein